jgi:hypothetical protein
MLRLLLDNSANPNPEPRVDEKGRDISTLSLAERNTNGVELLRILKEAMQPKNRQRAHTMAIPND